MRRIIPILVLLSIMLGSCKSIKYVPVVTTRTDTCYITKHQRDSIYIKDSTHVSEQQRGDTIYIRITKWHTKYEDRAVHDTTYIATHDTIPQPYPVPEYIERKLTWWQKTKMNLGLLMIGIVAVITFLTLYKICKVLRL